MITQSNSTIQKFSIKWVFFKQRNIRSDIKRPTDNTKGTTSGQRDATSGQTSATSGQASTTNGQTNGQTSTTSGITSTTSGQTSTTSVQTSTTSNTSGQVSTMSDQTSFASTTTGKDGFCDNNYPELMSSLMREYKIIIFFLKTNLRKSLFVIIIFTCTGCFFMKNANH